jgi:hypothetical protein
VAARHLGNWGWAIIAMTIMIKSAFYPLNHASARSMAKMKVVAPKMKALQEQYANDKQQLQVKMMELYRQEKINPLGRLPADPRADPGVHRALLGAALRRRAAACARGSAGSTISRRPIRTSSCRCLRDHRVPAGEAVADADQRSRCRHA